MAKKKKKSSNKSTSAFDKLSIKHKLFVAEYIRHFGVAYKAYMAVYKSATVESARAKSSLLLTKVNVKRAIEEKYQKVYNNIQSEVEKAKTYQLINNLGSSNIFDIVDLEKGILLVKDLKDIPVEAQEWIKDIEMVEKETKDGVDRFIKVKLHSKLNALELRAKIQKLLDPKAEAQPIDIKIIPARRPKRKIEKESDQKDEIIPAKRPE